ncbi:hypothetical protein DPMN_178866 [Dreissena polymorpha]|uniref:Uncharacterized protein n=1 Tax=Dreissena polymorpha TaxID=45954 RepID=A0A9D4IN01_DREPO|nr:hypothetical protein DPMN_178866 [Dreissena polymorpha]
MPVPSGGFVRSREADDLPSLILKSEFQVQGLSRPPTLLKSRWGGYPRAPWKALETCRPWRCCWLTPSALPGFDAPSLCRTPPRYGI